MSPGSHSPKYQQIIRHFEKLIFDGVLGKGDRIGSTTELSKQFNVNPETVQIALSRLTQRGLIERRRRTGSFVRGGVNGRTVGIVFWEGVLIDPDMAFFNVYLKRLTARLSEAGWDYKHFITGAKAEYDSTFHELQKGMEDDSLRAVTGFCHNPVVTEWLQGECPVPFLPPLFEIDRQDLVEQGLDYLFKMGRKNPVVICGGRESPSEFRSLELCIQRVANTLIGSRGSARAVLSGSRQLDGYESTIKLIESGADFDSLLVYYDSTFRGALYALLERGLKIPDDVAVISHANKGVDIFCHIPLTKLEFDPDDFAKATVESLECRVAGKEYLELPAKASLLKGRSCGE